jgi:hypothetical protein
METGQYLMLSTADLPPVRQPLPVAPTQYGWFLPTREIAGAAARHLPKELPAILALGRNHGCDYVLLDCDGPTEDVLPTFPW